MEMMTRDRSLHGRLGFRRRVVCVGRWLVGGTVLAALTACGGAPEGGGMQIPPAPVSVAQVVSRAIVDVDEFTGRIEALDTVDIQPRVSGYLDAVHFREGSVVEKGDLLFTVDPREYEAAVGVARANVERAETRIVLAEQDLARSDKLIEAQAISREEYDQRQGELRQATADRSSARAQLVQAELNLSFARITAPIRGRIGAALIKPGNLLVPGQTVLTTLVSIDPIFVTFEADEGLYLEYQARAVRNGEQLHAEDLGLSVQVGLAGDTDFPYAGQVDFIDNRVNPATGTIRARAVLANPDGSLTPGLFARVRLMGTSERSALLIHDMAVLTDQDRKYVFVVGANSLAERRDVVLGDRVEGLRIVTSGLGPDDRVVVNGVRRIFFPGMPLTPESVPMDQPLAPTSAGAGTPPGAGGG
jgi:multidrug efflux system membrane fusion protein